MLVAGDDPVNESDPSGLLVVGQNGYGATPCYFNSSQCSAAPAQRPGRFCVAWDLLCSGASTPAGLAAGGPAYGESCDDYYEGDIQIDVNTGRFLICKQYPGGRVWVEWIEDLGGGSSTMPTGLTLFPTFAVLRSDVGNETSRISSQPVSGRPPAQATGTAPVLQSAPYSFPSPTVCSLTNP